MCVGVCAAARPPIAAAGPLLPHAAGRLEYGRNFPAFLSAFSPAAGLPRPSVLTRKNALFAGSDGGARHWAVAMTLIQTAKLNGVDPMAWLTDVLERIVSGRTKAHELPTPLPWTWAEAQANSNAPALAA